MTARFDDTLAYMDQGSYLALRALRRGPVIQYAWIYDRGVDIDGLRRFQHNLTHTLLGRRLERSVIPFGRHHWVRSVTPNGIEISAARRCRDQMWDYLDERADVAVDPEHGPPWHLGVQPLQGGGSIVTLVVSHTIADAGALIESITHAVSGTRRDLPYRNPRSLTRGQAMRRDLQTTMHAVREVPAAVVGAARMARAESGDLSESVRSPSTSRHRRAETVAKVPTVSVAVEQGQWDSRAKLLGGTGNVLLAGLAVRIGVLMGRVDAQGTAMLSLPVSERIADDTRGNALSTITVLTDAARVTADLGEIRRGIKAELTELADKRELMLAPLPLAPYMPEFLVRRLERLVLKVGKPIGTSNLGDLPKEVNRPDGSEADFFTSRLYEPGITTGDLDRMGGRMILASGNVAGKVCASVSAWEPAADNTKAVLAHAVTQALSDFGLTADVE